VKTFQTIALHEFKGMFRRRMFLITTIGFPVIAMVALLVIGFIQSQKDEPKDEQVGYVDVTGLFTESLIQGPVEFVPYDGVDAGMEALLAENIKRLYIISPDYLETGAVQRISVSQGIDLDSDGDRVLRSFLFDNLLSSDLPPEMTERLKNPLVLANVQVDSEGAPRDIDPGRVVFFLGMGMLLVMSLVMTGGFLLQSLGEEKENRIMEVLLSSVTPGQLMVGKILGLGAAGLVQILVWLVSGITLLTVINTGLDISFEVPGTELALVGVLFFVLGYLFFATLMAGMGAIASTAREGSQLSIVFVLPLFVPVYVWFYIMSNPTAPIVQFLTVFPFTAPVVVMERLAVGAIGPWQVILSLGVLALSVIAAMYVMIRVFRTYLLSYGKRPGLRDVLRTLARS
jgi:ABC-2 type transport system permease protein